MFIFFTKLNLKCRYHPGLRPASLQDVLPRSEVLLLPWGAADENAPNAGAALAGFQSCHRYEYLTVRKALIG